MASVGAEPAGGDSSFAHGAEHRRAGAVAEEDAGGAVLPVHQAGHGIGGDE